MIDGCGRLPSIETKQRRNKINEKYDNKDIEVERHTVSREVLEFSCRVANRSQQLAELVCERLHPVMIREHDSPKFPQSSIADVIEYPPLFESMRTSLTKINNAIGSIERSMARTEL